MFLVLHVHYHTYVFCCRNTELEPQKLIVRFILRHIVHLYSYFSANKLVPVGEFKLNSSTWTATVLMLMCRIYMVSKILFCCMHWMWLCVVRMLTTDITDLQERTTRQRIEIFLLKKETFRLSATFDYNHYCLLRPHSNTNILNKT